MIIILIIIINNNYTTNNKKCLKKIIPSFRPYCKNAAYCKIEGLHSHTTQPVGKYTWQPPLSEGMVPLQKSLHFLKKSQVILTMADEMFGVLFYIQLFMP